MALDIVDWAIIIVGLTMLPMLPDLLGNILIAFLPDAYVTASVRRWYFFFTLITGPRRSLSLELSDTRVYQPHTRVRLGSTWYAPLSGIFLGRSACCLNITNLNLLEPSSS